MSRWTIELFCSDNLQYINQFAIAKSVSTLFFFSQRKKYNCKSVDWAVLIEMQNVYCEIKVSNL